MVPPDASTALQTAAPRTISAAWDASYFIGLGRAMVSLGPFSSSLYCPYRCRFCYVQGPFPKYASATSAEIVEWLQKRRDDFDIIYVSGDTDSFAAPRTLEGLGLLRALLHLDVDVLFTTRYIFTSSELALLHSITQQYRERRLLLIGCISISQLNHPALEPQPIGTPHERFQLLDRLQQVGIATALTIRPFIPSVPATEYADIAMAGCDFADIVLGGDLYVDPQRRVLDGIEDATGLLKAEESRSRIEALDFSLSNDRWDIIEHPEAVRGVSEVCRALGRPFFMRSSPAVQWLRERRAALLKR